MIQTVTGKIHASELGYTLTHEHLFVDARSFDIEPDDEKLKSIFQKKVALSTLGYTMNNPYAMLDNAFIDDYDVLVDEVRAFFNAGGRTIVDVTLDEIGRNPSGLRKISEATGVHIIAGCGHYLDSTQPEYVKMLSVDELAAEMIDDIKKGINKTDIKAGVIGEIGTSAVVSKNEMKCLEAAGYAHKATGAGVHVHTSLWETNGIMAANMLISIGVPAEKICINHIDVDLRYSYLVDLCHMGVMIEFDDFGKEYYISKKDRFFMKGRFAYDLERVQIIHQLISDGYINQILVTNDICLKSLLHTYGGRGYDHILTNIIPMMEDCGIYPEQIEKILVANPANFLDM